ncbi:hypothetical protein L484_006376 [Morus notabilis]|uniref:Uncharacterized protein n=1 Tax=Morus notabilis TaxID=981085 RepID=W9QRB6_9ROSA|nr:keratin, type I cytoskeletal 9 [Morus notabilis]EXB51803.1 hypothetical protein L484_006376 [Morus notabilis]
MNLITSFLLTLLLITSLSSLSLSARPGSDGPFSAELKGSKGSSPGSNSNNNGGFFGPGPGFNIPGFGNGNGFGGGYGYGYGGPKGGHDKGGIVRPTVVCTDKGPCYKKKLTCPAKCFTSYSRSGKGYGGGGGGGGCTMDCKKKCVAYC